MHTVISRMNIRFLNILLVLALLSQSFLIAFKPVLAAEPDTEAPIITVNSNTTFEGNPELTGTIDDVTATIEIDFVGNTGSSFSATNNGDGTWTLAAGILTDNGSPLMPGTYDIIATATDPSMNIGTDASTDELVIESSDDVTPPTVNITGVFNPIAWNDSYNIWGTNWTGNNNHFVNNQYQQAGVPLIVGGTIKLCADWNDNADLTNIIAYIPGIDFFNDSNFTPFPTNNNSWDPTVAEGNYCLVWDTVNGSPNRSDVLFAAYPNVTGESLSLTFNARDYGTGPSGTQNDSYITFPVIVDNNKPDITNVTINGNAAVGTTTVVGTVNLAADFTDENGMMNTYFGVDTISFVCANDWPFSAEVNQSGNGSCSIDTTQFPNGPQRFVLSARDKAGNVEAIFVDIEINNPTLNVEILSDYSPLICGYGAMVENDGIRITGTNWSADYVLQVRAMDDGNGSPTEWFPVDLFVTGEESGTTKVWTIYNEFDEDPTGFVGEQAIEFQVYNITTDQVVPWAKDTENSATINIVADENHPVCGGQSTIDIDESRNEVYVQGHACGVGSAIADDGFAITLDNWYGDFYTLQGRYFISPSTDFPADPESGWFNLGAWGTFTSVDANTVTFFANNSGNTVAGLAGWQVRVVDQNGNIKSDVTSYTYSIEGAEHIACTGVIEDPEFTIVKTASVDTADVEDTFTYTITVTNSSEVSSDVSMTDELPYEVDYVSHRINGDIDEADLCQYDSLFHSLDCEFTSVDPDQVYEVVIEVTAVEAGMTLNSACVSYMTSQGQQCRYDSALVQIGEIDTPYTITKTVADSTVRLNNKIYYTITITNESEYPSPVIIIDELPEGVEYVTHTVEGLQGESADCEYFGKEHAIICGSAFVSPSEDITIDIEVTAEETGTIVNEVCMEYIDLDLVTETELCDSVNVTVSSGTSSGGGSSSNRVPTVDIIANPAVSVQLPITLTAQISGGNSPVTITEWFGGNFANCSGASENVVTPSTVGSYTCSVRVTDIDGDIATDTITVQVVDSTPLPPVNPNVNLSISGFTIDEANLIQVSNFVNANTTCSDNGSNQCTQLVWEVKTDFSDWKAIYAGSIGTFNLSADSQNANILVQNYNLADFYAGLNNFFIDDPINPQIRVRLADNSVVSSPAGIIIRNILPTVTLTASNVEDSATHTSGQPVPTMNVEAGETITFSGSFTDYAGNFDASSLGWSVQVSYNGTVYSNQSFSQNNNILYSVFISSTSYTNNGVYDATLKICEEGNPYGTCAFAVVRLNVTNGETPEGFANEETEEPNTTEPGETTENTEETGEEGEILGEETENSNNQPTNVNTTSNTETNTHNNNVIIIVLLLGAGIVVVFVYLSRRKK